MLLLDKYIIDGDSKSLVLFAGDRWIRRARMGLKIKMSADLVRLAREHFNARFYITFFCKGSIQISIKITNDLKEV